jgi:peptidyl-prolyl cis-trans isomerase C
MRISGKVLNLGLLLGAVSAASQAALLAAENAKAGEQPPGAARKVAATVNGTPIYEDQVNADVEKSAQGFKRFGMKEKEHPELMKQLRKKALDKLIGNEVLAQECQKLKIDDVEQRVEEKVKALEMKFGAGEGVEKYLKRKSLTLDDFKKSARKMVYVDEYLKRQGISDPKIPEESIRKMYQENSDLRQETVRVSHVLIATDPKGDADKNEKARQKAEQLREEIVKGKDFAETAKEHSNCNSAAGGGDLGFIDKGYMPKEFDQAAFALQKGAVSAVVKTKFGYHIIKVLDKKPGGIVPFEETRGFFRKYLQQEESKKLLEAHVAELKKKAKIEVMSK